MKLVRKVVNDIILDLNKQIQKEDVSTYAESVHEYVEGVNKLLDMSKIPLLDDDASPEEIIDCMFGLQSRNFMNTQDTGGNFIFELQDRMMLEILKRKGFGTGSIPNDVYMTVTLDCLERIYIVFNSAKKINHSHLLLRMYFDESFPMREKID